MPPYRGCQQTVVDADPATCFAAMTDYDRMPEWQGALERCEVVEREPGGALVVRYEVDAKVTTVQYTLRHTFEEPSLIDSEYLDGPFREFGGRWTFEPALGDRCLVTLDLTIDPGRWMPGPVVRVIRDAVVKRAVDDLRTHVEGEIARGTVRAARSG